MENNFGNSCKSFTSLKEKSTPFTFNVINSGNKSLKRVRMGWKKPPKR